MAAPVVEVAAGDVPGCREVWINRPDRMNALDVETLLSLDRIFAEWEDDADVRVAVVAGRGNRAFSVGADLAAMQDVQSGEEAARRARLGQAVLRRLWSSRVISIAAIQGYALGGGLELAMALDFRVAADTARLGQPEINLGLIPGFGGTQRLPRLIGESRALWMILSGEPISAADALAFGLVDAVVPADRVMEEARRRAAVLAAKPPAALAAAKRLVKAAPFYAGAEGLEAEAELFGQVAGSETARLRVRAFWQRRTRQ